MWTYYQVKFQHLLELLWLHQYLLPLEPFKNSRVKINISHIFLKDVKEHVNRYFINFSFRNILGEYPKLVYIDTKK